jgi:8-oxo-dGTP diphosphatase
VDIAHLEQVGTFSGLERDPRGWPIAVLFCAFLPRDQLDAVVRDKVEAVDWVDPSKPGQALAFDHGLQLSIALNSLRSRVERHVLPLHLMPELFTLTSLQNTCEVILGRRLEKSAFRRRLRGTPYLVATDEYERGVQRPAQLYRAIEGFVFNL